MIKNKNCVYKIEYGGEVVYIGRTNNLTRREKEHNRFLRRPDDEKTKSKVLYHFLLESGCNEVKLILIKEFKNKVESKRFECLLILLDWFSEKKLKQKVPNISDR
jgi:predicted GIY-YIG superfamily endonuclease